MKIRAEVSLCLAIACGIGMILSRTGHPKAEATFMAGFVLASSAAAFFLCRDATT